MTQNERLPTCRRERNAESSVVSDLVTRTVEPGRAIVGSAGVTLYRVLAVKHGARTYVVVDGGMSDNPRPALYGSR